MNATICAIDIWEDCDVRKILMLVPCDIFPPAHGGAVRARFTIKHLMKKNHLNVLLGNAYSLRGDVDLFHPNLNIQYCPETIMDKLGYRSILFNPMYFQKSYKFLKESDSDIIHCELLWSAFSGILLKKKFKKPLVLVDHNVEYLKFKQFGKIGYSSALKSIEKICCEQADKIVVVSEVDKAQIMKYYKIPEEKLCVIVNSVDTDTFKFNDRNRSLIRKKYNIPKEAKVITFVGKLNYYPNYIAVRRISEIIYPKVIKYDPKTYFLIIGDDFSKLLQYKKNNMIFTGYVYNISDYLSASDIVIAPIESGSGTRLKILEAASCSRPIISTSKGVEGQDFINCKEIIIAKNVDRDFINGIIEVMGDSKLGEKLGKGARTKVEKYYNWENEIKKYDEIYDEICVDNIR